MASASPAVAHLEGALAAAGMYVWSWDIATGQVEWSPGVEALVGLPDGSFGGTFEAYQRVLHPEDKEAVLAAVRRAVEDPRAPYEIEHRVCLPLGAIRWLMCRGHVSRDDSGKPLQMLGVVWDTTPRKTADARIAAAEAALRLSEERKHLLVEHASDGIIVTDARWAFIDANSAALRMLGYTREQLLAVRVYELFDPDDLRDRPLGLAPKELGVTLVTERRMRRRDGTLFDAEISARALPGGNTQAFVRSLKEKKELEAQLLRADRLASLGRLAAGVAHEINNPLTYISLHQELAESQLALLDGDAAGRIGGALKVAREGIDRVRKIVRELATFGRGEEKTVYPVDVNRALDGAVDIVENKIRHRATLTRHYAEGAWVRANEFRLGQVFVNLLVNAADAIDEGGVEPNEIHLETALLADQSVVVSVSDTGAGIDPATKAKIFDPFFTTKPVGVGTGLGLWTCHHIVTELGGAIRVDDNPGRGVTFRVTLPGARSKAETPTLATGHRVSPVPPRASILVVDDEPALGRVIASLLSSHEVTVARGGEEAKALLAKGSFDCILCDVMMPDIGGPELYVALREDGRGLERRMVFMTGGAFTTRAGEFLASVPNRCLEKPFGANALLEVIDSMLEDAAPVGGKGANA